MNDAKRFRAVDLFLILLTLFAVIGAFGRAGAFHANSSDAQKEYLVSAIWSDVDSRTVSCLQNGEWLYTNAGERFGQVTDIEISARETSIWDGGRRFSATFPKGTQEDVFLTVLVNGNVHEGVFLRENGRALLAGESYRLYSERVSLLLTVQAISPS